MARVYEKGQITIPKDMRDRLGIRKDDEVILEIRGDEIVVRKAPSIFGHRPARSRREVGLTDAETIAVAHEDRVARRFGLKTDG